MIDPMSRANFHRLWDDKCIGEREEFFKMCEKASDDPVWGKAVAEVCLFLLLWSDLCDKVVKLTVLQSIHAIRHDFTQYFKSKQTAEKVANGIAATS